MLISHTSLVMEALALYGTVRTSGAAAHVDATYYGRVPVSVDRQKLEPMLSYLKTG